MTKNIQNIMKQSVNEGNNNLIDQSKIIVEQIAKNDECVREACAFIKYISSYKLTSQESNNLSMIIMHKKVDTNQMAL